MSAQIQTAISINASQENVWRVLTNLNDYDQWNPFIVKASGKAEMNQALVCKPKLPGGRTYVFKPTVTRCKSNTEFAWTGHVVHRSLASGEHIFRIIPESENSVRLEHDEEFTGILAPLFVPFLKKKTTMGFELMNEALKTKAESIEQ